MTRLIAAFAFLTVLAGTGIAILPPGEADAIANADTCETSHAGLNGDEMAMIDAINQERLAAGLAPYLVSAEISKAAAWMAEDVSTTGNFAHVDSEGRWPNQRGSDCIGVSLGETLAAGSFGGPAGVVAAWMASPGHRDAILNSWYGFVGVGIYGGVYVANFGATAPDGVPWSGGGDPPPSSSPPPPPPTATPTPIAESALPTATPVQRATQSQPQPNAPNPGSEGQFSESRSLAAGVNLLTYTGASKPVGEALGSVAGNLTAVYQWDASSRQWRRYFPGKPDYINSIQWLTSGDAYFIVMDKTVTWQY